MRPQHPTRHLETLLLPKLGGLCGAGNSGGHSGREGNDGGHSGGAGNGGEHTGVPLTVLRQVLLLNFRALVEVPEACRSSRTGPHVAAVAPST